MNETTEQGKTPELLTRYQLSEYLGLCLSLVDRLDIPRIKLSARRFCYKKSDVDLWLEQRKGVKNAE